MAKKEVFQDELLSDPPSRMSKLLTNLWFVPSVYAVVYTWFVFYTGAKNFTFLHYAVGLFGLYSYAFLHPNHRLAEKHWLILGVYLWNMAYLLQIYDCIDQKRSNWPMINGTYWIVNEYLTAATKVFEPSAYGNESPKSPKKGYVTPLSVRIGYGFFAGLDVILNLLTVYYGTGDAFDEFGLFPIATLEQRVFYFAFWIGFWLASLTFLSKRFGPRQTKYFMACYIYIGNLTFLRMPAFADLHSRDMISNILKFQIFGSATWVVKYKDSCDPQVLYKWLYIIKTPFCAFSATVLFNYFVTMDMNSFRHLSFVWLAGYWPLVEYLLIREGRREANAYAKSL